MPMTDERKQYLYDYQKKKLKRIPLDVPIEVYEKIRQHAEEKSESVNGFIKRAIAETMEREQTRK